MQFAQSSGYVVIADLANYFDTIPLQALRNAITGLTTISENVLNLMFFVLEALAWRPYFMPHPGVGLPQLMFDAPRLLAHVYLYKLDVELERLTEGSFVRWMDDINAGVTSPTEGRKLLGNLQELLNSQALQLNSSKSKVLSGHEALDHFCARHNRALTILENSFEYGVGTLAAQQAEREALRDSYRRFKRSGRRGQWDKVQKRYLRLFGVFGDAYPMRDIRRLLHEQPSVRDAAFRYMTAIGFTHSRLRLVQAFLESGDCEDEGALFGVVDCLLGWQPPQSAYVAGRMTTIANGLSARRPDRRAFSFGAALAILAKYGSGADLASHIVGHVEVWTRSSWASRQVAAVTPRLDPATRQAVLEHLQRSGLLQGLQVFTHLKQLSELTSVDRQLEKYLTFKPEGSKPYPLYKILIALAVLAGRGLPIAAKSRLRDRILESVSDPYMRALLIAA